MVTLNVYNRQGDSVGTVEIDPAEFGGEVNRQLLHDVVVQYLANQRAGTHSTLRRGEVAGSTKKLFRQKGTGNARAGTRRTNKRRGGGTSKGPKPRDYEYHMPKKMVRAALRMAILSKFLDNEAVVVDDLAVTEIKTKPVVAILKALKLQGITTLIGTISFDADKKPTTDQKLYRSARNIEGVEVLPVAQLNAYNVLKQKRLLLTKAALEELRQAGKKKAEAKA
jgi:large subunit ribosomal protein L4